MGEKTGVEPHPPTRPKKLSAISGTAGSKLQPVQPLKKATPPITPHAPATPKDADQTQGGAGGNEPPKPKALQKKISVDSYVIKNGTKTVVQRVYTLEDLEEKKKSNPKYASDWQKLIDQFEDRWVEQRKISIDSYVIKDGKKTLVQRQYTKKDLEAKKRANPKYAADWQTLIEQFDTKFEEQEKKRAAEAD